MENPRDSNSGGDAAAAGSGDGADSGAKSGNAGAVAGATSRHQQQQLTLNGLPATTPEELSQLARAAITSQQGTSLFAAGGDDGLAGNAVAGSAEQQALALQDPNSQAALAAGADGAMNALLLNSGINLTGLGFANLNNLNQAALDGLMGGVPAGQAAAGAAGAADGIDDDGSRAGCSGQPNNKQLSSRFRGVCWNKKNKRWQAAINSGGKYIYLGSFTSENDAARQFDRAAIKIRGKKAKLNFTYADYVDADGNLLEDVILPTAKEDTKQAGSGKASGRGHRSGGNSNAAADAAYLTAGGEYGAAGGYGDGSAAGGALGADMLNQAALALVGQGGWGAAAGRGAAAAGGGYGLTAVQDGSAAAAAAAAAAGGVKGRNIALLNMSDVKVFLPKGCSMEYMLPGLDADMFGLVYKSDATDQRGSGLWTGYKFHAFGLYMDEADAKNTVLRAMELLHEDRLMRGAAGPPARGTRTAADSDPLLSALGLGGLRSNAAAAAGSSAAGVMFGSAGGGRLAHYDIARAAQLAQQAAAEQGVSMTYPALSAGLPVMAAQPADGTMAAAAGQIGAGDNDLQQRLQQIMAGQQQLEAAADAGKPVAAASSAGDVLSRLGNLDVSQLRHLLPAGQLAVQQQQQQQPQQPQQLDQLQQLQQQQMVPAAAAATPVGGALGSTSIEELLSAIQSQTAGKCAAGGNANWAEMLALAGRNSGAATAAMPAGVVTAADAMAPAAKRMRTSDGTAAAVPGVGDVAGAGGVGDDGFASLANLSTLGKVGLQDALKSLAAMTSQAQQ